MLSGRRRFSAKTCPVDAGGFPGWLTNIAGTARTNATDYTAAWLPWIEAISKFVAPYQVCFSFACYRWIRSGPYWLL